MRIKSRVLASIAVAVMVVLPSRAVWGQQSCPDAVVRATLAHGLDLPDSGLQVTRDYSSLFPSATFYRAGTSGAFHSSIRRMAVVTVGATTEVVRSLADLGPVWRTVRETRVVAPEQLRLYVQELMIRTGFLDPSDHTLRSEQDLSPGYRVFLDQQTSLREIVAPTEHRVPGGTAVQFFVESADGVGRINATLTDDGSLTITLVKVANVTSG